MKEMFSILAVALTLYAYWPYIRSIRSGKTQPHVFSWIIWGMATVLVFFAQLADGAGAGAWPIGISGVITLYVGWLAYNAHSAFSITRTDWLFFISALSSLPVWYATSDPLWAVVILTTVDVLGFAPTFRKSYRYPYSEQLQLYAIMGIRNATVILALEKYSFTTVLFPAVMTAICGVFIFMLSVRRWYVKPPPDEKP